MLDPRKRSLFREGNNATIFFEEAIKRCTLDITLTGNTQPDSEVVLCTEGQQIQKLSNIPATSSNTNRKESMESISSQSQLFASLFDPQPEAEITASQEQIALPDKIRMQIKMYEALKLNHNEATKPTFDVLKWWFSYKDTLPDLCLLVKGRVQYIRTNTPK